MAGLRAYGLMYHDVVADHGKMTRVARLGPNRYNVTWTTFLEHLDLISEIAGRPSIVADVPSERRVPAMWSLTFDDGGASALEVGAELLRRRWHGYFFITTGRIGSTGFVDADAIRALDGMGHAIGSHSVTHPARMAALAPEALLYEWQASVDTLSDVLSKEIRTASIPGGHYGTNVAVTAARAGIETLFTSDPVRTARRVGGCVLIGRYSIRQSATARDAARAAAGNPAVWARQYVGWNLRKSVKALAGDRYYRVRRSVLNARSDGPSRDS